ncbi:MAG: FAD-binding oxidoreductase [bacterium]
MKRIRAISSPTGGEMDSYLEDESHLDKGQAEAVYLPENEGDICSLLVYCHEAGKPVTISGARTGVVGGAIPRGGVVISMEKMDRILGLGRNGSRDTWFIKAEPGVRLQTLQKAVEKKEIEGIEDSSLASDFRSDSKVYMYPPDPTEGSALLGGTVVSNSSGARSFAYGPTRNYVHRLRVVLANGELLDITRGETIAKDSDNFEVITGDGSCLKIPVPLYHMPPIKNAAGYYARSGMDLIDLFIGSEGTLGVITYLELKIVSRPEDIFGGIAFFKEEQKAIRFVQEVKKASRKAGNQLHPSILEYFDSHSLDLLRDKKKSDGPGSVIGDFPSYARGAILFEQFYHLEEMDNLYDSWQTILEENKVDMDDTWAGCSDRDFEKLKCFRHALPETLNELFRRRKMAYPQIHKISLDFAVPEGSLEEMIRLYQTQIGRENLQYVLFGHIGENHLHVNILPHTDVELQKAKKISLNLAKEVISLGGTISAEHGIGKMKHRLLELLYGRKGIQEMVNLKLQLDPKGILNRGNIFPEHYLPHLKRVS